MFGDESEWTEIKENQAGGVGGVGQVDFSMGLLSYPTDPSTTFDLHSPSLDVPEQTEMRQSPDLNALKL